jgi:hypothetical protein
VFLLHYSQVLDLGRKKFKVDNNLKYMDKKTGIIALVVIVLGIIGYVMYTGSQDDISINETDGVEEVMPEGTEGEDATEATEPEEEIIEIEEVEAEIEADLEELENMDF